MVLTVDGLRMRYGDREVLHDVTFEARPGEVLALLGPNGAGKSTTIEILEGFRLRSAGRVEVLGVDPAAGDERWRSRIGIVLQSWRDHGNWRVGELLHHLGSYYTPYQRAWPTGELLDAVGLTPYAGQKIKTLSGGQRRRLDVAIGIVGRPDVLFLDEPTTGFDPEARSEFHELVRGLAAEQGTTILLTTHDLDEASKLAHRILVLAAGRIIAAGSTAQLTELIAGEDEVRWSVDGQAFRKSTADSTAFVRELFATYGDAVSELEVRRVSLEDTYLALVREQA
ncbi:ABC-2 type transport system ATP-binding protein [Kribbella sp. VKM Ac-2569]|uniref:ABC transporter ATP-binding protein n=1 Tax=Kribbella sp. VKM Ac-2569 TaxID=2512220 RepID=UPI00102AA0A6|nr:ABC transporter ATP-binding protein [Kribbella sp. VKM Ac-2569]RZT27729.1 ABC-2 type transport system ATP-binding protein [Kribbella sp. VKM Ac-2569]